MALEQGDLEYLDLLEQRRKNEWSEISNRLELANCIVDAIRDEFKQAHLANNLVNTMKVKVLGTSVIIDIPARKYNMKQYKLTGVIKYYNRGSYANIINDFGEHKGWVERCIKHGISKWLAQQGSQGRISYNE